MSESNDSWERRARDRVMLEPARPIRVLTRPRLACIQAALHDFTLGGVGLLIDRPLEIGTSLILTRMSCVTDSLIVSARVTHCELRAEGDWLVGCDFARTLSEKELKRLFEGTGPASQDRVERYLVLAG